MRTKIPTQYAGLFPPRYLIKDECFDDGNWDQWTDKEKREYVYYLNIMAERNGVNVGVLFGVYGSWLLILLWLIVESIIL